MKRIIFFLIFIMTIAPSVALADTNTSHLTVTTVSDNMTAFMDDFNIRDFFVGGGEMANDSTVNAVMSRLESQRVNPRLFDKTEIYIFPACCMQFKNMADPVLGITYPNEKDENEKIVIAGQYADFQNILVHELGHVVLNTHTEIMQEYAKIRKYPYALDIKTQEKLQWGNKIYEWFAEDFEFVYCSEDDQYRGYTANTSEPDTKIINFIKLLVKEQAAK